MSNQKNRTPNDNGIIKEKLKKVAELKEMGIEPYGRTYKKENEINKYDGSACRHHEENMRRSI